MRINQIIETQLDELDRRGFLKGLGAAGAAAAVPGLAKGQTVPPVYLKAINDIKSFLKPRFDKLPNPMLPYKKGIIVIKMSGTKVVGVEMKESTGVQKLDDYIVKVITAAGSLPQVQPLGRTGEHEMEFTTNNLLPAPGESTSSQEQPKAVQQPPQADIPKILEIGKRAVIDSLNDPDSGKVKDLKVYDTTDKKGNEVYLIIGRVNGKNRMGGYVGYKLFGVPIYKNNSKAGEVVHDSTRGGYDGVFINLWFGRAINDGKLIYSDNE